MRTRKPITNAMSGTCLMCAIAVIWATFTTAGLAAQKASTFDESLSASALQATNSPADLAATNIIPGGTLGTNSMETLDDKHNLAIGDRISFRILEDLEDPEEPLDPKPLTVLDSGEIEVPYIGRVMAENKTCKHLASQIKQLLEREYYHQATVLISIDIRAKTRGRVYIVGPVRSPGPQEIPTDEVLTIGKAIMRAGGFGDFADRRNVKITRKDSTGKTDKRTITVDVADILDKGRVERDLPLEPGDLVIVPERSIRF